MHLLANLLRNVQVWTCGDLSNNELIMHTVKTVRKQFKHLFSPKIFGFLTIVIMKPRRINYDSGSLWRWDSTFLAIGITKGKCICFRDTCRGVLCKYRYLMSRYQLQKDVNISLKYPYLHRWRLASCWRGHGVLLFRNFAVPWSLYASTED